METTYSDYVQKDNDLIFVQFEPPITFTSKVKPICLPPLSMKTPDLNGLTGEVAGFGKSTPDSIYPGPFDQLKVVNHITFLLCIM